MAFFLSLTASIVSALALAFAAEWMNRRFSLAKTLKWCIKRPGIYLSGALSLLSLIALWSGVLGRLVPGICVTALIVLGFSYANYLMLHYREQPLMPRDLAMLANLNRLVTMISPASVAALLVGILLLVGLDVLLQGLLPLPAFNRTWRLGMLIAGFGVWAAFCTAGRDGSPARKLMTALGADFETYAHNGDVIGSFQENGFLAATFSLCLRPIMERPKAYCGQAVAQIIEAYPGFKLPAPTRDPHILMIMSEAFSDPLQFEELRLSADPIPHIRRLLERYPSGQVLAPGFGGGTAHCEFEALTGFSTGLTGGISPFENNVNKRPGLPSLPRQLLDQGYRTLALHPYRQGMYARAEAYPNLGIQHFIDISGMQHTGKIDNNPYVSDEEAYREVLEQLDKEAAPLFLHLVTMQNHGEYRQPNRFQRMFHAEQKHFHSGQILSVENYVQGLHYTDEATAHFLDSLSERDDDVLVVFWGDHLPAAYPPDFIRHRGLKQYATPFFIWANFPLDNRDYGIRSPMMLPSLLRQAAGLPLSGYDAFLLELQQQIHAVHSRFVVDADGNMLHRDELTHEAAQLLDRLHLVQYDAMLGEGKAAASCFFDTAFLEAGVIL